jgi:uncharacterized membrane protein
VALGGFFDGILLHQILQWHHLFSLVERAGGLAAQVMWDGVFHLGMYAAAGVGVWLLWRGRAALARPGAGRRLAGWALVGFGGWHVADAIVSHWLLGIHRIRDASPTPLVWDLAWFAVFGLAFVAAGVWMLRRPADGGGGARRGAAALGIAVLVAGPWAALPPEGGAAEGPAVALAVFLPGTGFEAVHAAAAAAGGVPDLSCPIRPKRIRPRPPSRHAAGVPTARRRARSRAHQVGRGPITKVRFGPTPLALRRRLRATGPGGAPLEPRLIGPGEGDPARRSVGETLHHEQPALGAERAPGSGRAAAKRLSASSEDEAHQEGAQVRGAGEQVAVEPAAGSKGAEIQVISQAPAGSAITQVYQIRKPPRMAPQLLPEPPTITITQIRKVKRSGM